MNLGTAQVIRANSRALPLADDSVDLVVTSPPYFALRSYQDGGEHYAGQIGDEPTPAEFVASLLEVTRECVRVLKPSGSLWVNLGDKYAGHTGGPRALERYNDEGVPAAKVTVPGAPTKSLIGIPWRYALACIDDLGLILRAEVIWSKPNGLPESVTDRVRRSHEQWFHFTLEPRYFSAVDEIREPQQTADKKGERRSYTAAGHSTTGEGLVDMSWMGLPLHPLGKLPGSVWTIPTEPLRVPDHLGIDHFAAFPTEWPKRIIAGWSPSGICVECGEGRRPVVERNSRDYWPDEPTRHGTAGPAAVGAIRMGDPSTTITGYACACDPKVCRTCGLPDTPWCDDLADCCDSCTHGATTETRPAVVLDPFGGTGTTAMVAKALGRTGISVDMSADYCRLAEWRTNDRNQLAKVLGIEKAEPPADDEQSLLDLIEGPAA
jgi:DNA modification methylase